MVLVLTFSDPMNRVAIWLRKFLAFSSLGVAPLMVSGIECFINIRLMRLECSHFSKLALCSLVLSLVRAEGSFSQIAYSRSIHPSKIVLCSFHFPKLVPLKHWNVVYVGRYNKSINCMQNKRISAQYTTMSFTLNM